MILQVQKIQAKKQVAVHLVREKLAHEIAFFKKLEYCIGECLKKLSRVVFVHLIGSITEGSSYSYNCKKKLYEDQTQNVKN